jgi:Iron-containing redox enzyme
VLRLPEPRGELSELLLAELSTPPHAFAPPEVLPPGDPIADDDLHLALYLCYELHYRGLPGVDETWEWTPALLAFRARLERVFEDGLRARVTAPPSCAPEETDLALRAVAEADDGPELSKWCERHATLEQMLEWVVHRSAYQLKEADPHSWAIPRLSGPPKAALVEIQTDEYGGGRPERMHAELFAKTMRGLGLDDRYGAYVEQLPGISLATVNLMSLCGLHRRLRGALVGHLALFEMASSLPNRRYGNALRRLGCDGDVTDFYDEHVEADAVHENIAAVDLAGGLLRREPLLAGDVLWGAAALVELDARLARHALDAWGAGASSLRAPLAAPATAAV